MSHLISSPAPNRKISLLRSPPDNLLQLSASLRTAVEPPKKSTETAGMSIAQVALCHTKERHEERSASGRHEMPPRSQPCAKRQTADYQTMVRYNKNCDARLRTYVGLLKHRHSARTTPRAAAAQVR